MSRMLITGGAGFIGANLADRCLARGDRITVLDNFSRSGTAENLAWLRERHPSDRLDVVRGDVRMPGEDLLALVEPVDVVFHLAAQVAVTTSVADPREDFEVNALGTFNVVEAVRRSSEPPILLYASTNKVYGDLEDVDVAEKESRYEFRRLTHGVPESRTIDLHSPYGCSKGAGDQYALDYARVYDLPTVVFRQSCIYGPRQHGVAAQGWVAWFAERAVTGRPVTIFGDGKQVRDVLHVQDLLDAFDAAVDRIDVTAGEAYNIGGGPEHTLSLLELVDLLESDFGLTVEHDFADPRPGDQLVFVSDVRKAERDFGWTPSTGVREGVESLVREIEQRRDRLASETARVGGGHSGSAGGLEGNAANDRFPTLSVVIPARNEEETLGDVLRDLNDTVPRLAGWNVEVICVDDGSTDATAEIAGELGATVVPNEGRHGKGMALRRGFEASRGQVIAMMDADYSHRPEDLPVLLDAMKGDVGLVIGSRVVGGSEEYEHVRALGNVFLSTAVGLCLGRYLSDALNGYKVFRRDVFDDFEYSSPEFEIEVEIIASALRHGYRVVEVSSHERERAGGKVKSRVVRHGTRFLLRILLEGLRGVKPREEFLPARSVARALAAPALRPARPARPASARRTASRPSRPA